MKGPNLQRQKADTWLPGLGRVGGHKGHMETSRGDGFARRFDPGEGSTGLCASR